MPLVAKYWRRMKKRPLSELHGRAGVKQKLHLKLEKEGVLDIFRMDHK